MLMADREDLVVGVHTRDNPSDEEWEAWYRACEQVMKKHSNVRAAVVTDGGGPNAMQRGRINDLFQGRPQRVGVIAPTFVRGVITALSWFNPEVRAFRPGDVNGLVAHLRLDLEAARWTRERFTRLRHELGLPPLDL
jgi:hypothetical protein